jgi:hypothetical protein
MDMIPLQNWLAFNSCLDVKLVAGTTSPLPARILFPLQADSHVMLSAQILPALPERL